MNPSAPVVAALLAAAAPLLAQAPSPSPSPDATPAPPRIEERVDVEAELPALPPANQTVTRLPLAVLDTPASVSVVPRALLDAQDAFFLGDALRNTAGTSVHTGFGVFDFFTIRGFDSLSSGLVLTDGIPEPEATFYALYNVRQVEVLKGPSAFLYGANPMAGAVHLVRKQPTAGRRGEASLSYGRFGTFEGAVDGNVAGADGRLALRVNGVLRDSAGYRDDKESRVLALNPTLLWTPSDRARVTLSAELGRNDFEPDSGLPLLLGRVPDVPRTTSYQSPFDESRQDVTRLRIAAERRIGDRLTLRDRAFLTRLEWKSEGTLLFGAFPSPFGNVVARGLSMLDDDQVLLGNQLEAVLGFTTGGAAHELLAGLEVSRLSDEFTLDVALLDPILLETPFETNPARPAPIPQLAQRGDATSTVVAPYLLDHVKVGRVHLIAGVRLDSLDYEEPVSGTQRDATKASPMAGITWSPVDGLALYASAGTAFAPPSTLVIGPREPEESRQVEAGVKRELLDGKAFASVAAYHLERDNVAIPDASGVTRQTGDQRSRGLEIEVSAEPAAGWYSAASYAWNDSELSRFAELVQTRTGFLVADRSGNTPAFAPRHLANAWLMRRAGAFTLGLGGRYVGRQFIAEDNAYAIDDYVTLDAMAGYRRGRFNLAVNAKNLTDRVYETRAFGNASVLPAEPFTIAATLRVGLGDR